MARPEHLIGVATAMDLPCAERAGTTGRRSQVVRCPTAESGAAEQEIGQVLHRCYAPRVMLITVIDDLEPAARRWAEELIRLPTGGVPTGEEALVAMFEYSLQALDASGFQRPDHTG